MSPQPLTPDKAAGLLGMVHSALSHEAAGKVVITWPDTPLGTLWGEARGEKLTALHWGEPEGYVVTPLSPAQERLQHCLNDYFKKSVQSYDYNMFDVDGTPFQQRVWQALCAIPFGETRTYGELASQLNSSPRAVGGAVGANPVPILIPCHRVMGTGGKLTGFSAPGGLVTKTWLLRHEGILA